MTIVVCQVKEIAPEARRRNAKLSFAFVYPDKGGRFVLKQVLSLFFLIYPDTCMCYYTLEIFQKSKQDEIGSRGNLCSPL